MIVGVGDYTAKLVIRDTGETSHGYFFWEDHAIFPFADFIEVMRGMEQEYKRAVETA